MRCLLIDQIREINSNSITAVKYLSVNEDIYEYHFPKNPVFPAAFMVEMIIQLGRMFTWNHSDFQYTLLPLHFKKFKFHKMIKPGLILEVFIEFYNLEEDLQVNQLVKLKAKGMSLESVLYEGVMECKIVLFKELQNEETCRDYLDYCLKTEK